MDAIRQFCSLRGTNSHIPTGVRELRSLDLSICDAKKLSAKNSSTYCIVSLNDVRTCKTKAVDGSTPVWGEDFKFE